MTSALDATRRSSLDLKAAKRWLLREVERMGFHGPSFDAYDGHMVYRYGGGRGRPAWAERIGKKYQWIALYRLVGLVADNVPVDAPDPWEREPAIDVPALQAPGERNLDPTLLLRPPPPESERSWWSPVAMRFAPTLGEAEWLALLEFPDSSRLVEVLSPDGRPWLALQAYHHWDNRIDRTDWDEPFRDCFMQLRSYLVADGDADEVWHWLQVQDFHGRWMPEGARWLPYVFAGEYPWAVQAQRLPAGTDEEEYGPGAGRLPRQMIPTALDQSLEFEFDAYHDGTISLVLPDARFFDGTGLRWNGRATYHGAFGCPVFLSPELVGPGPRALLVDRGWLESWLAAHSLTVMWTVLSEKHWHPGGLGQHDLGYAVHSRGHCLTRAGVIASKGITRRVAPK